MNDYDIMRIAVDLLAPGALVPTRVYNWYTDWDKFHTRRMIYPVAPANQLFKIRHNGAEVLRDLAHIRLTAVGYGYVGMSDGNADEVMTSTDLSFFLGPELPRIVQKAIRIAPPYVKNIAFTAWMEIWETDEAAKTGKRICDFTKATIEDLAKKGMAMESMLEQTIFEQKRDT